MDSEPHIIVEKEVSWDDFIDFIYENQAMEIVGSHIYGLDRVIFSTATGTDGDNEGIWRCLLSEAKSLFIINGFYKEFSCFKIDNETIKYGLGSFYINKRVYDTVEDGNDYDGYPTYTILETYTLQQQEIKVLTVAKYA